MGFRQSIKRGGAAEICAGQQRRMLFLCFFVVLMITQVARGQDQASEDRQRPGQVSNRVTVVRGVVRVGASGQPLPRALVRINGDAATGVLTDGDGRFEIADVPQGPLDFTVTKPGFLDEEEAVANSTASHGYGHNVIVAPGMGDVVFTMEPLNSIRGQIQLSTGDVAEGIQVVLLKRSIQDGRAVWQTVSDTKTNSEGVYRFGGLSDGLYAVYTMPAMDSGATALVEGPTSGRGARGGYASLFFPDARDLASASKIQLSGGEQVQANFALTLEPFQPVVANVTMPQGSGQGDNVAVQVLDGQGHVLPYTAQYDASTHTAQTMLPDGTYSLIASATTRMFRIAATRDANSLNLTPLNAHGMAGLVSFAVTGRAVSNIRLAMAAAGGGPVQVSISKQSNGTMQGDPRVIVTLSQTGGWIGDGLVSSYAEGSASSSLVTMSEQPGSYWVHTSIGPKTLCEASFTAGGASLGREPLVFGVTGVTAPLMLSLRDDCAKLNLSLPNAVGMTAGEERSYLVYAVPDFDSTQDVTPVTLRPSSGGRMTLTGLTPGNYHVYAFASPIALEYRNREALAAVPGQAVSLAPDADTDLTIEVPQR